MELGCPTARGWMAIPGGARHRCHQGLSQLLTPLPASSLGPALSLQPLSVHPGNSTAQLPVQKALKCRALSPEEPLQEPLLHAAGFVPCLWHSLPSPRSGRGACWRRGAAHAQGCDPSWRGSTGPGMHCSSVRPHCLFPSSFPIAGHTQGNRRHLLEGALVSAALGLLRFPQQAQHYPHVCVCARRWASLPAELWQSKSGSHTASSSSLGWKVHLLDPKLGTRSEAESSHRAGSWHWVFCPA